MEFRNSQAGSNARRYPEPTRQNAQAPSSNENTTQGGGAETPVHRTMNMQNNSSSSKFRGPVMWVVGLVVVVLLALGAWFAMSKMSGDAGVKGGQYQAVFLTNGQVYFGKVSSVNSDYVQLSDIYYLQVQQSVQPDDKSKAATDQSQVSLAKLGSELHGPEDAMHISRQQVLFWENLKNDGKVVQAINSYKQQNK
jgi:hypothetical protein